MNNRRCFQKFFYFNLHRKCHFLHTSKSTEQTAFGSNSNEIISPFKKLCKSTIQALHSKHNYKIVIIYFAFQETKLDVFNKLTLDEGFCVGMNVNGITKWLEIPKRYDGATATAIFVQSDDQLTSLGRQKWESLINGSFVDVRKITMH